MPPPEQADQQLATGHWGQRGTVAINHIFSFMAIGQILPDDVRSQVILHLKDQLRLTKIPDTQDRMFLLATLEYLEAQA